MEVSVTYIFQIKLFLTATINFHYSIIPYLKGFKLFKGSQCAFRHQPAAKSTEVTCPEWLKGVCFKPTCLLRHMLVSNTRTQVHCKWEAMPSGCLDPGCTYTHINKKVVMPGATTVDIKGSSASTVKQPLLSSTLPLAALKFSNDMPALQTNNTILPPTNPIGQMVPAIVMVITFLAFKSFNYLVSYISVLSIKFQSSLFFPQILLLYFNFSNF